MAQLADHAEHVLVAPTREAGGQPPDAVRESSNIIVPVIIQLAFQGRDHVTRKSLGLHHRVLTLKKTLVYPAVEPHGFTAVASIKTSAEPAEAARLRQGFGGHPHGIPPRLEPTLPK